MNKKDKTLLLFLVAIVVIGMMSFWAGFGIGYGYGERSVPVPCYD